MFRFCLVLLSVAAAMVVRSASADTFQIVDIKSDAMYVPVGFDDNDEALVVLDGYLPDPCYRLTKPYVNLDTMSHKIVVTARARKFEGLCPDVRVPFTQEVSLGRLSRGEFTVETRDERLTERLTVKPGRNPGPDDYLYAPVEFAHVTYPGGFRWTAVLEGRFTNSCMSIQETKVVLTGKTIQVLPIMKMLSEEECGHTCRREERSFKTEVELPMLESEGRYLLHVRSLNGASVNEVFYRTPHNP